MKVWVKTFGCRANQYDSEAVRDLAVRGGHSIVADAADADLAIFNSCGVTSDAVADLRQAVRRAARDNPRIESVVMGCASALPDASALRSLPGVSRLVEGADLDAMAEALGVALPMTDLRTSAQSGARALLRIQDGCDEHCTFCATTIARGANRSRAIDVLVDEALMLSEKHVEIVITGIHIGTYGADTGTTLGALMKGLVDEIPQARFRLTSIEANEIDETLLELMAHRPRHLVPNIHAPLQSGSDRILKRMGRHWYTAASYRAAVERMAERLPIFGLGADIITGFPGETDADHAATVELAELLPFTYLHVFPYSLRPGTAATRLDGQVAPEIARERARELRRIGTQKEGAHRAARTGTVADVVVLGGLPRRGLTEDYLDIAVIGESTARGRRVNVELAVRDGELTGVPLVTRTGSLAF